MSLAVDDLVDVSDIFYFFLLGGGEGGVRGDRESVGRFLLKMPRGAGLSAGGGAGRGPGGRESVGRFLLKMPRGAGLSAGGGAGRGPGGCPQGIWGGGRLKIFFRGRNARQDEHVLNPSPKNFPDKSKCLTANIGF